jgi:hypothetical protein
MSSNAAPDFVSVPHPSHYRLDSAAIDHSRCVGRNLRGGEDRRWSPVLYYEHQCGRATVDGSDLCSICKKHETNAAAAEDPGTVHWDGRITEDPPAYCRMLGTTYSTKCKYSDKIDTKAAEKEAKAAEKAAAKEAKKAEKAAAKAAKKLTPLPPPEPESPTPVPDPRDIEIARLTAEVVRLQAIIALIHNATTPVP